MNRGWNLSPSFPKSPFCPLAKNNQNLNRSQISVKIKVVQNFVSYKTSLMTKDRFEMERDEFEPNSWKFKTQIGKNSNFELGQIRNSKITFDFPKQLEKLPT
jgi:hypothetical protein